VSVDINVLGTVAAIIGIIMAGYWALASLIVRQFNKGLDDRFKAQEKARIEGGRVYQERLVRVEEQHHELERSHMKLLADLPREYVRREDHIRFETVLNAKLDALHSEMRLMAERQVRG